MFLRRLKKTMTLMKGEVYLLGENLNLQNSCFLHCLSLVINFLFQRKDLFAFPVHAFCSIIPFPSVTYFTCHLLPGSKISQNGLKIKAGNLTAEK